MTKAKTADPAAQTGKERLKEILSVLSKHNVIAGMTPEKLCSIIEDLGPTFVKLGQIMSMRTDILPAAYCEALQKLCSSASPMPMDEVRRVIEGSLNMPLEEAFPYFDQKPLGSASIAQVHHAHLKDGQDVVVKVQREGIHDKMQNDIALLKKAAGLLKLTPTAGAVDLNMVLDEMWVVSQEEMNFGIEAKNAEEFARLNQDVNYVRCPTIYRQYSTQQVLVMDYVKGHAIDNLEALKQQGYDMAEIAQKLCMSYMKQVLDDGFFHADPHPGNLRVEDGRIVWLDLGMVGHLSAQDQSCIDKGLRSFAQRDAGGLTDVVLTMGVHHAPINREVLYADVDDLMNQYVQMDIGSMDLGQTMQQVLELAKKHSISMPSGVSMLGRGVCTLQGVIATISPETSIMSLVAQRFSNRVWQNIDWKQLLLHDMEAVYESAQKSLNIPALISDTLRLAQKGQLKLIHEQRITGESEQHLKAHMQRLRLCILCCALFLGSSLMTLMPQGPRLFGIPLLSLIGFVLCAGLGVALYIKSRK